MFTEMYSKYQTFKTKPVPLKCFWGLGGMGGSGSEERKISAVTQVGESKLKVNSNICLREKEQTRSAVERK